MSSFRIVLAMVSPACPFLLNVFLTGSSVAAAGNAVVHREVAADSVFFWEAVRVLTVAHDVVRCVAYQASCSVVAYAARVMGRPFRPRHSVGG